MTSQELFINRNRAMASNSWNTMSEKGEILRTGIFGGEEIIDVSELSQGVYFLMLPLQARTETQKFIVIK